MKDPAPSGCGPILLGCLAALIIGALGTGAAVLIAEAVHNWGR